MKTLEQLAREIASLKQAVRDRMRRDAHHRSDPAFRQMRRRLRRWQRRRRALLIRQGTPGPARKGAGPPPPGGPGPPTAEQAS